MDEIYIAKMQYTVDHVATVVLLWSQSFNFRFLGVHSPTHPLVLHFTNGTHAHQTGFYVTLPSDNPGYRLGYIYLK